MNLLPVEAEVVDGALHLSAEGVRATGLSMSRGVGAALAIGNKLRLGVRPEHLVLASSGSRNSIAGRLFANENMGPESLITIERGDGGRVTARIFTDEHLDLAGDVAFTFEARHATLFGADGNRIAMDGEEAFA